MKPFNFRTAKPSSHQAIKPRSHRDKRRAFTIIEIIITIVISAIVAVVIISSLVGEKSTTALNNSVQEAATTLREAQSRSVSQEGGVVWGVHFDNNSTTPFFALYKR